MQRSQYFAIVLSEVLDQLKLAEEQLAGLEARLALQKKFLDELTLLVLAELSGIDNKQDNVLTKLEEDVSFSAVQRRLKAASEYLVPR